MVIFRKCQCFPYAQTCRLIWLTSVWYSYTIATLMEISVPCRPRNLKYYFLSSQKIFLFRDALFIYSLLLREKSINRETVLVQLRYQTLLRKSTQSPAGLKKSITFFFFLSFLFLIFNFFNLVDIILGIVNRVCVLCNYIVHGFMQLCCIFHYFFLVCLLKLHFTCLIMQFKLYQIWNTDMRHREMMSEQFNLIRWRTGELPLL